MLQNFVDATGQFWEGKTGAGYVRCTAKQRNAAPGGPCGPQNAIKMMFISRFEAQTRELRETEPGALIKMATYMLLTLLPLRLLVFVCVFSLMI